MALALVNTVPSSELLETQPQAKIQDVPLVQDFFKQLTNGETRGIKFYFRKATEQATFSYRFLETNKDFMTLDMMENAVDVYFTPNIFFRGQGETKFKRKACNVWYYTSLWADLDSCSTAEGAEIITNSGLPTPSAIFNSGRGLHAYWLFQKNVYAQPNRDNWKDLMTAFTAALDKAKQPGSAVDVDPHVIDHVRVLRVPTSMNSKNKKYGYVVSYQPELRYSFTELYKKWVPDKPILFNQAKAAVPHGTVKYAKVKRLTFAEAQAIAAEYRKEQQENAEAFKKRQQLKDTARKGYNAEFRNDIMRLIGLRGGNCEGHRYDLLLFLWRMRATEDIVRTANNYFTVPLAESELQSVFSANLKHPKRYKVYNTLAVTKAEEKQMTYLINETDAQTLAKIAKRVQELRGKIEKLLHQLRATYFTIFIQTVPGTATSKAKKLGISRSKYYNWKNKEEQDFMALLKDLKKTCYEIIQVSCDNIFMLESLTIETTEDLAETEKELDMLLAQTKEVHDFLAEDLQDLSIMQDYKHLEARCQQVKDFGLYAVSNKK